MANTITITGPTFANKVGIGLPTIPGLLSLAYFGTGFDNISGNRVTSGPAFATVGAAPTYQSNYVTAGNISAVNSAIDTQNPRTAGMLASGWSWAAVARCTNASGTPAAFVSDANAGGSTHCFALTPGATKLMGFYYAGLKAQYTAVSATSSFRFFAATYSGGALGTVTMYDFTDNITPVTYTLLSSSLSGGFSPHFGAVTEGFANGQVDTAFGMVASGVLTQTALGNIAVSVRASLARRGITI